MPNDIPKQIYKKMSKKKPKRSAKLISIYNDNNYKKNIPWKKTMELAKTLNEKMLKECQRNY